MSIASRITSIEEHLKESYQELEGIGIDTTGVNNNLENIPKLLDGYWETLPKVTDEGTSITLDNTKEGKMKVLLKGNTYQDSTTGKNLLNIPDGTYQDSGHLINAVASNGEITLNGTTTTDTAIVYIRNVNISLSASAYTWSANNPATNSNIILRFDNNVMPAALGDINKTNTKLFESEQTLTNFAIRVAGDTTLTNFKIKPQFEKGNTATSWEKGTKGASPNPDYPQNIHTVSGDNTIETRTNSNLQSGEQLYQTMYDYDTTYVSEVTDGNVNAIKFNPYAYRPLGGSMDFNCYGGWKESTQYTIRCLVKNINGTNIYLQALYTDGTSTNTQIAGSTTEYRQLRFLTSSGKTIQRLGFSYGNAGDWLLDKSSWYIGEGNQTEYPEYKGTKYPINLGIKNMLNLSNKPILKIDATNTFVEPTIEIKKVLANSNAFCLFEIGNASELNGEKIILSGKCLASGTAKGRALLGYADANGNNRVTIADTSGIGNKKISLNMVVDGSTYATKKVVLWLYSDTSKNGSVGDTMTYENIMVSTENGSYTPYNATLYELNKIGTYQDRFIRNSGKNLFDGIVAIGEFKPNGSINAEPTRKYSVNYIEVEPSTSYASNKVINRVVYYDKDKNFISRSSEHDFLTFTTLSNAYYIRFDLASTIDDTTLMLNKGTTALPYEPYGTNEWYLEKKIGKYTMPSNLGGYNTNSNWFYLGTTNFSNIAIISGTPLYCNNFANVYLGDSNKNGIYNIGTHIIARNTNCTDLASYKTYFTNNETIFYSPLSTPTYTKIEGTLASQLEALNGAKSYTPQTNISQENNDMASVLNATALSE